MKRFKSVNGQKLVYESYDRLMEGWTVPYEQHEISTSYGITHVITAGSSDLPRCCYCMERATTSP